MNKPARSSLALRWICPVVGLCAAVAAGVLANAPAEPSSPRVLISCGNLTSMLLGELGVTTTTLATLGASNQQVSTIVAGARQMCEGEGGAFGQAHVAWEEAATTLSRLESKAQRGDLTDQARASLESQRQTVNTLRSARDQIVANVQNPVESTLDAEQRAELQHLRAASHINVPEPYKVLPRTDAEWIALRDRLSEERTVAERGEPIAQAVQVEPEVQVAQAALEARLPAVRAAWRAALAN